MKKLIILTAIALSVSANAQARTDAVSDIALVKECMLLTELKAQTRRFFKFLFGEMRNLAGDDYPSNHEITIKQKEWRALENRASSRYKTWESFQRDALRG